MVYLAACLLGGLAVMVRALTRLRSVTARRQLRWIVWGSALGALPFLALYLIPFLFGHVLRWCGVHGRAARLHPAGVRLGNRALSPHGHRGDHQEGVRRRGGRPAAHRHLRRHAPAGWIFCLAPIATTAASGRSSRRWLSPWSRRGCGVRFRQVSIGSTTAIATTTAAHSLSFTRDLNSDLDVNRLGQRLVDRIARNAGHRQASRCCCPIRDGDNGRFVVRARRRTSGGRRRDRARIGAGRAADGRPDGDRRGFRRRETAAAPRPSPGVKPGSRASCPASRTISRLR